MPMGTQSRKQTNGYALAIVGVEFLEQPLPVAQFDAMLELRSLFYPVSLR